MAIEGLQVILDKEAVVPTPTADRLVNDPSAVEGAFLHHVRTYVPFGRASGADDSGDALSISDYEQRLIAKVKAAAAPKGYITADFGYGKTSTALHVWDRCRRAGLLAVPPFQLGRLDDLIHASFGWARHELRKSAPALVPDLERLYATYRDRSIESDSGGDAAVAAKLRELQSAGRYNLTLVATDYATFFEQLADLAGQAGFSGITVLADELQQYLDPAIRGGTGDPIAPLHNIVEALNTRRGQLPVGLIFSLLLKDFGLINDQRGDFIQRLKADGLGIDLRTIYDRRFATRLWDRLAEEFEFADEAPRIVSTSALDALGQIAARDDLANGPRTVIDAFRWVTRRYLEGATDPVTSPDLVDAFLAGTLVFDGTSKLQTVVQKHLETPLVASRDDLRRVVKVLAAFPTNGASEAELRELQLLEGAQELDRLARGDVTIMVGGGLDDRGERVPFGYTLHGLEPQSAVAQDWLTQTLREFSRNFVDTSETTVARAETGFSRMLTDVVFRSPGWKQVEENARRRSDNANRSLLFEGSFPATNKRYPSRRLHVRILRDGEIPEPPRPDVDVTLDVTLSLNHSTHERERRQLPGTIERDGEGRARLCLNLFHREGEGYYQDLQAALQPVVSPNRVTPLLLLALHSYLEEKRNAKLVPKENDPEIEGHYQPRLLEHSSEELLNTEIGAPFGGRGPRVMEQLFRELVESRYPAYHTVMRQTGWAQSLMDYQTALERLDTRHERRGAVDVELGKEDLARRFNRANTSMDSLITNFPELLVVEPAFKGRAPSKVRFRLHPFEERVLELLRGGTPVRVVESGRTVTVNQAGLRAVEDTGAHLGYRPQEIGRLLDLLGARELVEVLTRDGVVREVAHVGLSAEDLAIRAAELMERVDALIMVFPDDASLGEKRRTLANMRQALTGSASLDEATLLQRDSRLRQIRSQLDAFLASKLDALRSSAKQVSLESNTELARTHRLNDPIGEEFFGPQLDAIRTTLLIAVTAHQTRRANVKERIISVIGQLQASSPTVESVVQGQQDVAALRRAEQELGGESRALDQRCRQLTEARRVLTQIGELTNAVALGVGVADTAKLSEALGEVVARIRAEISSRKEIALDGAARWDEQLAAIRSRLNERVQAEADAFNDRHRRYLAMFQQHLSLPAGAPDPIVVAFNPANPAASRAAQADVVAKSLAGSLDRISEGVKQFQAKLLALRSSGDLQLVDDPTAADAACRRLLGELDGIADRAVGLTARAGVREVVDDVDGRCVSLFNEIQLCFSVVQRTFSDANRVLSTARLRQLDEEERGAADRLRQLTATNGEIDIGILLQDEALRQVFQRGDAWKAIEQLYSKRRISVIVRLSGPLSS